MFKSVGEKCIMCVVRVLTALNIYDRALRSFILF